MNNDFNNQNPLNGNINNNVNSNPNPANNVVSNSNNMTPVNNVTYNDGNPSPVNGIITNDLDINNEKLSTNNNNLSEQKKEINSLDLTNTNIDNSIISKQEKSINTIDLSNAKAPMSAGEEVKEGEYKKYIIHRNNSKTLLFVTLVLSCVVAILFIIVYLYMPEYEKKHSHVPNDKTTTNDINEFIYIPKKISSGLIVTSKIYKINDDFTFKTEAFRGDINVYVNDSDVTSLKRVYGDVALIDDLFVFAGDDMVSRTAKIFFVDKEGKIVKQIENGELKEAKIVNNSIKITQNAITFKVSKVDGINLYSNNQVYSVCDKELKEKAHVDEMFVVENTYELVYDKNHEFKNLKPVNNKTLASYIKESKVCY